MSEEITNGIRNLIAKLDNGSHSSSQLQAIDEALTDLLSQALQKRDEEIRGKISKYKFILEHFSIVSDGEMPRIWKAKADTCEEILSTLTTK